MLRINGRLCRSGAIHSSFPWSADSVVHYRVSVWIPRAAMTRAHMARGKRLGRRNPLLLISGRY